LKPKTLHGAIKLRKIGRKWRDENDEVLEWVRLEILEAEQVIGTGELFIIKADDALFVHGVSLFDVCDLHQETYECGEAVYDLCADDPGFRSIVYRDFLPSGSDSLDVVYLSKMEIGESFRKRGIGFIVLKKMMQRWGKGCALAVLKPFPLQHSGKDVADTLQFKKDSAKLIRYYSKLGFRKISSRHKYGTGFHALPLNEQL
jgi:hypothetical protein